MELLYDLCTRAVNINIVYHVPITSACDDTTFTTLLGGTFLI